MLAQQSAIFVFYLENILCPSYILSPVNPFLTSSSTFTVDWNSQGQRSRLQVALAEFPAWKGKLSKLDPASQAAKLTSTFHALTSVPGVKA